MKLKTLEDVQPLAPELPDAPPMRIIVTVFTQREMQVYLSRLAEPLPLFAAWQYLEFRLAIRKQNTAGN